MMSGKRRRRRRGRGAKAAEEGMMQVQCVVDDSASFLRAVTLTPTPFSRHYPLFNGQDGKPQHHILAFTRNGIWDIGIRTEELVSTRGPEDAIHQVSYCLISSNK